MNSVRFNGHHRYKAEIKCKYKNKMLKLFRISENNMKSYGFCVISIFVSLTLTIFSQPF